MERSLYLNARMLKRRWNALPAINYGSACDLYVGKIRACSDNALTVDESLLISLTLARGVWLRRSVLNPEGKQLCSSSSENDCGTTHETYGVAFAFATTLYFLRIFFQSLYVLKLYLYFFSVSNNGMHICWL